MGERVRFQEFLEEYSEENYKLLRIYAKFTKTHAQQLIKQALSQRNYGLLLLAAGLNKAEPGTQAEKNQQFFLRVFLESAHDETWRRAAIVDHQSIVYAGTCPNTIKPFHFFASTFLMYFAKQWLTNFKYQSWQWINDTPENDLNEAEQWVDAALKYHSFTALVFKTGIRFARLMKEPIDHWAKDIGVLITEIIKATQDFYSPLVCKVLQYQLYCLAAKTYFANNRPVLARMHLQRAAQLAHDAYQHRATHGVDENFKAAYGGDGPRFSIPPGRLVSLFFPHSRETSCNGEMRTSSVFRR